MDLGELGGFGDVEKTETQEETSSRRGKKENPPVKVAGSLRRSFGGSSWSRWHFKD